MRRAGATYLLSVALLGLSACGPPPEPVCGDGVVEGLELCDDGNTVDADGCSATCLPDFAICGDRLLAGDEECDDGNTQSGDGCSAFCREEGTCGNGEVEPGEQCDDGNTTGGDGCSASCTTDTTCGDGVVEPGEQCDDGNTAGGDGCDSDCSIEGPAPPCGPELAIDCGQQLTGDTSLTGLSVTTGWGACTGGAFELAGPELAYAFTAATDEAITVRLTGLTADLDLLVLADAGAGCDPASCQDGLQSVNAALADEEVGFVAVSGASYYLVVESLLEGGAFTLELACPSVASCGNGLVETGEECDDGNVTTGDGCDDLCQREGNGCGPEIPIACATTVTDDTSMAGLAVFDDYACFAGLFTDVGPELSFVFTPTTTETVVVSLTDLTVDLDLLVIEDAGGTGCDPTQCMSGMASTAGGTSDELVMFSATSGTTYYLVVESFDAVGGPFSLLLDCPSMPICGNGVLEPSEECDDGNTSAGDGCDASCLFEPATCGNGVLEMGEECDDGNTTSGDGCDDVCGLEPPVCGNGLLEAGEECDDGNTMTGDGCDDLCALEPPVCGDSTIGPGEQCDDGNTMAGDGCNATCQRECGPQPPLVIDCTTAGLAGDTALDGATDEDTYPCLGFDEVGPEIHYLFAPSVTEEVRFDLTMLGDDLDLMVLPADAMSCSACDSALVSTGSGVSDEQVSLPAEAGGTYHVIVESYGTTGGPFVLDVSCASDAVCGNLAVEAGETCDDGNTLAGDGCDDLCRTEGFCVADPAPGPAVLAPLVPEVVAPFTPALDRDTLSCGGPPARCASNGPDAVIEVVLPAGSTDLEMTFDHAGGDHLYAIYDAGSGTCSEVSCFDPYPSTTGTHLFSGVSTGAAATTLHLVVEACNAGSAATTNLTLTAP